MAKLTVISLGAGVQSSVMALMAAKGEITPMPDCAVFADTQSEPSHVYEWLDWLELQLPFPVHRVSAGSLRDDLIRSAATGDRVPNPPLFVLSPSGDGMLFRQCTSDYKIKPIHRKLRELIGLKPRQKAPKEVVVEQWIGISQDEIQRMKLSRDAWVQNRWPLLERRMSRLNCLEWMRENGYNELPKKSACTFCPYHDDATWREMKANDPVSWDDAIELDREIRLGINKTSPGNLLFLHRSRIPLSEVDLTDVHENQKTFSFMDECDGMCGV
jgi:hypothetical protein